MEENQIYAMENNGRADQPGDGRKDRNGKYFCGGLFTGLAMALIVVCSVYLVNRMQVIAAAQNSTAQRSYSDKSSSNNDGTTDNKDGQDAAGGAESGSVVDEEMIEKLRVIEEIIETYYYKEDIDKVALMEGAFRGMVDSLGDPYSQYYSEEELAALYQDSAGVYYGIGAYVSLDATTGYAKITGIIAGTPAEEAGIREDDIVYKVNGEDTYGLTLTEVTGLIKGEEGTYVHLTLVRGGKEVELDVVRRKVESPTVNYEMYDNGIAYIQITEFDTVTEDQFAEALAMARGSGMRGLILDLRSNPGGNLMTVVSIARMLLPKGIITYTQDRDGYRVDYKCDGKHEIDVPMVVLVNGNSASASELLTGAIKDYGVGVIMGTTTFGKGIVQRPIELTDGSAVKLTVSSYYTPNGVCIHGTGIEPDIVVEFDSDSYYSDEAYDNQLEAAKEYLRKQLGN